jgi:long-chain fatty acid transport protein
LTKGGISQHLVGSGNPSTIDMNIHQKTICKGAILGSMLSAPLLPGAGFQLAERSASGLGRAFSGEAAIADDASVIASNPAALIMLGGEWNFSTGVSYIEPGADATLFPALTGGNAGQRLEDDDIAESAVVPYFYASKRLSENLVAGFGTFTTYGLRTDYSQSVADQIGTNYSEITTINFNPSLSYRINDVVSIGAGFNVMYAEGEITANSVALPPAFGGPTPAFGLEGDDWGFGYNLGILFELSENTRVGLSYRSKIDLDLEGSARLSTLGPGSVPGDLSVELPATAEFSIFHQVNDKWAVHGDVFWTQWSVFETLAPQVSTGNALIDAGVANELRTPENWNDAFRYSLGATYQHNDCWTFRAGVAYDESPVDDEFRTLRIPDGDRVWLSFGASYEVNDNITVDAGYSYVLVEEVSLGENDRGLIDTDSIGEGNIHLFALGVSGSF